MRILAALGLMLFVGDPSPLRSQSQPAASLDVFRRLFEQALTNRDLAALQTSVGPVLIFHARGNTVSVEREKLFEIADPILRALPDIKFVVDDVVQQGDKAAVRLHFTGTHQNEWQGIKPTGKSVTVTETFFCRLANGLLVELWQEWDEYGLRRQLTGQ